MNVRVADTVAELVKISAKYPEEEILVRFHAGDIRVGFAKGPCGDQQHAAWTLIVPLLEA